MVDHDIFPSGALALGCNYWSSHAGVHMWRNWDEEIVRADLRSLASKGISWLRVFPLWPDFQPIYQLRGQNGRPVEIRFGEEPLPTNELGRAGLSKIMIERFRRLTEIAELEGVGLVVGLLTGWMSGRLFVPPALEGLNPITDPTSVSWQIKFVQGFVEALKGQASVIAWDLGNECNCMGLAPDSQSAYVWTAGIANAIRAADRSRPIVSGMHTLSTAINNSGNAWLIEDQAALTDVLTTHPYPYWVRHADNEALCAFKTTLHATAETRFYSDIGGRPCIVEEIGSMGPMIASDQAAADFARINMLSLWVNDCRAMAWWCAHDQMELEHAPYDWNGVEVELGLLRSDGRAKPVMEEMNAFAGFLRSFPVKSLPKVSTDAICLVSHNHDDWAVAYGAFVLAKQAKLNLRFAQVEQALPEAPVYLLPCISGPNPIPKRVWRELLQRVEQGAVLYVSLGTGILEGFNAVSGVELRSRARNSGRRYAMHWSSGSAAPIKLSGGDDFEINLTTAELLGTRSDTNQPVFWRNGHGNGKIYVLCAPLEAEMVQRPQGPAKDTSAWKIYETLAGHVLNQRLVTVQEPKVAATEHKLSDGSTVVALLNHHIEDLIIDMVVSQPVEIEILRGEIPFKTENAFQVRIKAMDGAVLHLRP